MLNLPSHCTNTYWALLT